MVAFYIVYCVLETVELFNLTDTESMMVFVFVGKYIVRTGYKLFL